MRQARRGLPTKWIRPPLSEISAWRTDPAGHGIFVRVGDGNVSYFAISLACASAIDKMMDEKLYIPELSMSEQIVLEMYTDYV